MFFWNPFPFKEIREAGYVAVKAQALKPDSLSLKRDLTQPSVCIFGQPE